MWKYLNNRPGDIFEKFPCTNPYENSSKTRTSLYQLRFRSRLRRIWSFPNSNIHRDPFVWKYLNNRPGDIFEKFPCTNPYENSSKTRTSLYQLRFRSRLRRIWSFPNSNIHRDPSVWKYLNNRPGDIFEKFPCTNPYENSSKTRTSLYQLRFRSRLRRIWSFPNSNIHRDPFVWKYQKNRPGEIFEKFSCTNPFENSSKTRTSLYRLRFRSGSCQISSCSNSYTHRDSFMSKYLKICPVKFSRNSRVLTPLRIRRRHELHYIGSDSGPDRPKYGLVQIHISIGTHLCQNIKKNSRWNFWVISVY